MKNGKLLPVFRHGNVLSTPEYGVVVFLFPYSEEGSLESFEKVDTQEVLRRD